MISPTTGNKDTCYYFKASCLSEEIRMIRVESDSVTSTQLFLNLLSVLISCKLSISMFIIVAN